MNESRAAAELQRRLEADLDRVRPLFNQMRRRGVDPVREAEAVIAELDGYLGARKLKALFRLLAEREEADRAEARRDPRQTSLLP